METTALSDQQPNHALAGSSDEARQRLAALLKSRRQELGISTNELERRTGIHQSRLSRWENGTDAPSRVDRLTALAEGLELPPSDLYLAAGLDLSAELPSMRPYLRSKYGTDLPLEAIADIEAIAARYGISSGPAPGEDE